MVWDSRLVYLAAACVFLIGICLGLAIDEDHGVYDLFKDWQTLAAGVLAIIAAFITVRQALIVDGRQQRRHLELVGLQLRGDRNRALRAAFSAESLNNNIQRMVPPAILHLRAMEVTDEGNSKEAVRDIGTAVGIIRAGLADQQLVAVEELLPPEELQTWVNARLWMSAATDKAQTLARLQVGERPGEETANLFEAVVSSCSALAAQLRAFANRYDPSSTP